MNEEALAAGSRLVRWMIVDDNENVSQALGRYVEQVFGGRVLCCRTAEEALEVYEDGPEEFGFVITDLEMPGMNGIELCCRLHLRSPALKILLITASGAVSHRQALEAGFSGLLLKPFTPEEFGAMLTRLGMTPRQKPHSKSCCCGLASME